jgi:hypothetical protein
MNNLQTLTNNITLSSLELVAIINNLREEDAAELQHYDFTKKIVKVLGEKDAGKFSGIYKDSMNRDRPCYFLPKREASLMVMSESYKIQAAVYDRLQELEQEKLYGNYKLPTNYKEAVANLLETLEQKEELEKQILLDKPKVEAFDNSKVIFSKKEPVYDKERGYKTDIQEVYPFLASDKITLILDYYTKTRFEDTNYYVKEEALEIVEDFFIDADFIISPTKKIVFVKHPCLLNQNLKVKKDKAIKYLGYSEEDFNK